MIKKMLIYGIVAFAAYKGLSFYTMHTITEKVSNCGGQFGLMQGVEESKLTREKFLLGAKAWRCVKRDQNFLEALFFKIPDTWINPQRPYVDPPFTSEELADDVALDGDIQKDIRALAKSYKSERNGFDQIMKLLTSSDKSKLGTKEIDQRYGRVSEELGLIVDQLSQLHPNTRQVDGLHQEFVSSLKRIASDGQELKLLLTSINRDLEEVDTILALPKNVIAENRSRLLNIQNRLTRAETEIQNKLETLKWNEKNAMGALDGLEALASKYGASFSK